MKTFRKVLLILTALALAAGTAAVLWAASVRSYDQETAHLIVQADPSRYSENGKIIRIGTPQDTAFVIFPDDRTEPRVYVPLAWQLMDQRPVLINPLVFSSVWLNRDFTEAILDDYPETRFILISHGKGTESALRFLESAGDQAEGLVLLDGSEDSQLADVSVPVLSLSTEETASRSLPAGASYVHLVGGSSDGFGCFAEPHLGALSAADQQRQTAERIAEWISQNLTDPR